MKLDKRLKIGLIVLLIILISVIAFAGIFIQDKNTMKNIVAEYKLGMDLKGSRVISIEVDDSTNTIYYDKDGKVVDAEDKEGSKEEVPVNSKESLTKENYLKVKEIIEKRLNDIKVQEYLIRQDENTGKIIVQIPEDMITDSAIQFIYITGKFTIEDEDGNVLLDNSNIKTAKVGYNTGSTGTAIYLNIEFNKDSIDKLKEISNTYKTSQDEDGNDNSKKININIDDSTLTSTSFSEEISNGIISLSVGTVSNNNSDLNTYLKEASNIAILINNGEFPVTYNVEQNRYVKSDISEENLLLVAIITAAVILIGLIIFVIKYKVNGLLASISYIGYTAVLLIVLRYTNVLFTTEGLFGVLIVLVLNYIFNIYLLKSLKNQETKGYSKLYNKTVLAMLLILIPAFIVGITLCFANWIPMYSFGAIMFWGILLIFVYNTIVTRTMFLCNAKKQ